MTKAKSKNFNISKTINTLEKIMQSTIAKEITPENLAIACSCADRMMEFLKISIGIEKIKEYNPKSKVI